MMLSTRNSSPLIVLLIILLTAFGCASKKKAQKAASEKARIEREEAERKQKAEELARLEKEAAEKAKREAEDEQRQRQNESRVSAPAVRLGQYFSSIATSGNAASANASINEALTLFASPDAPVLIVISEAGGMKDYDKPTTIRNYLNYLKDQKKNINAISDVKTDGSGKITELELRKN